MLGRRFMQVYCYNKGRSNEFFRWNEGIIRTVRAQEQPSTNGRERRTTPAASRQYSVLFEGDTKAMALDLLPRLYSTEATAGESCWFLFGNEQELDKLVLTRTDSAQAAASEAEQGSTEQDT